MVHLTAGDAAICGNAVPLFLLIYVTRYRAFSSLTITATTLVIVMLLVVLAPGQSGGLLTVDPINRDQLLHWVIGRFLLHLHMFKRPM